MKTLNYFTFVALLFSVCGILSCSSERPQSDYGNYNEEVIPVAQTTHAVENSDSVIPEFAKDTMIPDNTPEIVISDSTNH